jgi:hypothetical protein
MDSRTLTYARVSTDHQHGKVWGVAREAEYRGFQVLMMTTQIYQRDELGGVLTDFFSCPGLTVIHHLQNKSCFSPSGTINHLGPLS